jgi:hypothetical protein
MIVLKYWNMTDFSLPPEEPSDYYNPGYIIIVCSRDHFKE